MKRWHLHLLFLFMLITLSAAVQAQDAGMSDVEMVDDGDPLEGEKPIYVPGEDLRYIPKAPANVPARDSLMLQMNDFPMQQATMKRPDKATEKQDSKAKDDSILTFNFLYYMIQKYKLQDIID